MSKVPLLTIPLVCYLMAAMMVCESFLSQNPPASPGGKLPVEAAGIAALIGVISHVFLYRFCSEGINHRSFLRFGVAVTGLVACDIGLKYFGCHITGLSAPELQMRTQTVLKWAACVPVFFLVFFAYRFLQIKFHPANQISQRIVTGDFDDAIQIGEKYLKRKWDFATCANLADAYARSGKFHKAREMIAELERTRCVHRFCTQEVFMHTLDALNASIEEASRHDR